MGLGALVARKFRANESISLPDIELDCGKVFADHFLVGGDHDLLAHALDLQFEIRAHGFARRQNDSFVLYRREALRRKQ